MKKVSDQAQAFSAEKSAAGTGEFIGYTPIEKPKAQKCSRIETNSSKTGCRRQSPSEAELDSDFQIGFSTYTNG